MRRPPGGDGPTPGAAPGTYLLLLRLSRGVTIRVGRLGSRCFPRGWYLYVGSAFGPGGVTARCNHHRRISARPRWHIDYLRAAAELRAIWFSHSPRPQECRWAGLLADGFGAETPVPGFGASDCGCASHLFHLENRPDGRHFSTHLESQCGEGALVYCENL